MNTFTAPQTPFGLGYTITSIALKYIEELESLIGPRTSVLPYGGVELIPSGNPHVWYPNNTHVVIRLTESVLQNRAQAYFQLSHEVVHVVCDGGPNNTATNFEEGIAAWFSKRVTDRESGFPTYADTSIAQTKYQLPFDLVNQLLQIDMDAINKVRKVQPVIGRVSAMDINIAGLSLPNSLLNDLLSPF